MNISMVLVLKGCHDQVPQIEWLKAADSVVSWFQSLEVQNQGGGKTIFLLRLCIKSFLLSSWLLAVAGSLQLSLACSCSTSISAFLLISFVFF